jgi:hypothetical protein
MLSRRYTYCRSVPGAGHDWAADLPDRGSSACSSFLILLPSGKVSIGQGNKGIVPLCSRPMKCATVGGDMLFGETLTEVVDELKSSRLLPQNQPPVHLDFHRSACSITACKQRLRHHYTQNRNFLFKAHAGPICLTFHKASDRFR